MKKIFTLIAFVCLGLSAAAQDDYCYQFVDKDGNVLADGTTIVRNDAQEDEWGDVQVFSGLFVKDVSAPDNYSVRIHTNITQIDNGRLQICFPLNCYSYSRTGSYQSETTKMAIDECKDIQSEWLPRKYGECVVTYQAMALLPMGNSFIEKGGPSVTIHYVYADPSAISDAKQTTAQAAAYYDMLGRPMTQLRRGLCIVRSSDGTVRRVIR